MPKLTSSFLDTRAHTFTCNLHIVNSSEAFAKKQEQKQIILIESLPFVMRLTVNLINTAANGLWRLSLKASRFLHNKNKNTQQNRREVMQASMGVRVCVYSICIYVRP